MDSSGGAFGAISHGAFRPYQLAGAVGMTPAFVDFSHLYQQVSPTTSSLSSLFPTGVIPSALLVPAFPHPQHVPSPASLVPSQTLHATSRFLTRSPAVLLQNIARELQLVQTLTQQHQQQNSNCINPSAPLKRSLETANSGAALFLPVNTLARSSSDKDPKRPRLAVVSNTTVPTISALSSPVGPDHVRAVELSDSEEETSLVASKSSGETNSTGDDTNGEAPRQGYLNGERRLIIDFESFGRKGPIPQTFGRGSVMIPDGLCGTHTVYQEPWRFEVRHNPAEESNIVRITWIVKNLNTGHVYSRTETREEAKTRSALGKTIANQVFREAMNHRAKNLENTMASENNETRRALLQSLIKYLRPTRFTQGPLVFGLQHRIVQDKLTQ